MTTEETARAPINEYPYFLVPTTEAADALQNAGPFPAIMWSSDAVGSNSFNLFFSRPLKILFGNHAESRKRAVEVYQLLKEKNFDSDIEILEPQTLRENELIEEWSMRVEAVEELQTYLPGDPNSSSANESLKANVKPLGEYEVKKIDWLWDKRIPRGCISIIEGDGGVGKSFVIAAIASAISSGNALPFDKSSTPAAVLMIAAEDDPGVVLRPRFEAHDANLSLIGIYDDSADTEEQ